MDLPPTPCFTFLICLTADSGSSIEEKLALAQDMISIGRLFRKTVWPNILNLESMPHDKMCDTMENELATKKWLQ